MFQLLPILCGLWVGRTLHMTPQRAKSTTACAAAVRGDFAANDFFSRVLRLTLLAPDIVEAILDGRQPRSLELSTLLQPLPFSWEQQRKLPGFQGEQTT